MKLFNGCCFARGRLVLLPVGGGTKQIVSFNKGTIQSRAHPSMFKYCIHLYQPNYKLNISFNNSISIILNQTGSGKYYTIIYCNIQPIHLTVYMFSINIIIIERTVWPFYSVTFSLTTKTMSIKCLALQVLTPRKIELNLMIQRVLKGFYKVIFSCRKILLLYLVFHS